MPISYLAQRDWNLAGAPATRSSNHTNWNEASTKLIRLNGGQPVIFSDGPNGKDQLTVEAMTPDGIASLVADFSEGAPSAPNTIDHILNADNVYADPALKEKLAEGI